MKRRYFLTSLFATGTIAAFSAEPASARLYEYARGWGISRRRLRELNWYSRQGQSSGDVRRILRRPPNHIGEGVESYTMADSVDYHQGVPINAGQRLIVRYGRDGKTADWYLQ